MILLAVIKQQTLLKRCLDIALEPKLHETGKHFQVSETGTVQNMPPKNGNVWGNVEGNAIYKIKIKIYICIYSFFLNKTLYCKKNIMMQKTCNKKMQ
jgi:hypothetical protein